jgi:alpha-tubulin suppressor-like RCC1 family protein
VSTAQTFTSLSRGGYHTCGLSSSGEVYCWGHNGFGQLGDGSTSSRTTPVKVNTAQTFKALASGSYHTCGLTTAGETYCWGRNDFGQLGDGTTLNRATPVKVPQGLFPFTSLSGGAFYTCALNSVGEAYCWGDNGFGQLGDGSTSQRTTPVKVSGFQSFKALSGGSYHICAASNTSSEVYCWGRNDFGQLGDGTATNRPAPALVLR